MSASDEDVKEKPMRSMPSRRTVLGALGAGSAALALGREAASQVPPLDRPGSPAGLPGTARAAPAPLRPYQAPGTLREAPPLALGEQLRRRGQGPERGRAAPRRDDEGQGAPGVRVRGPQAGRAPAHGLWAADHAHNAATCVPLLVLDMYEHAFHMDYGAAAARYVDAFMSNVRWAEVGRRVDWALKAMRV